MKNKKEELISYCQVYEDIILYNLLKNVKNGFYIDVGANDPIDDSVTKLFYEKGWNGVNVEPLKEKFILLEKDRKRDLNLNIGLGDKDGVLEFVEAGVSSSFDKKIISDMIAINNSAKIVKVPVKTLNSVYKIHNDFFKKDIHFLKIDVENFEYEVLKGIDFNKIKPWVVVLEKVFSSKLRKSKSQKLLEEKGYIYISSDKYNSYYIHFSHKALLKKFLPAKELIKKYDIHNYCRLYIYTYSYSFKIGSVITKIAFPFYVLAKKIINFFKGKYK